MSFSLKLNIPKDAMRKPPRNPIKNAPMGIKNNKTHGIGHTSRPYNLVFNLSQTLRPRRMPKLTPNAPNIRFNVYHPLCRID